MPTKHIPVSPVRGAGSLLTAQTTGCSQRELVRVLFSACLCPHDFVLNIFTSLQPPCPLESNALGAGAVSKIQAQHTSHFRDGLPGATTTERRGNICCNSSAPWDLSLSDTDAKASEKTPKTGSPTGCLADRLPDLISCPCGKPLSWHFQKALKPRDGPGSWKQPWQQGWAKQEKSGLGLVWELSVTSGELNWELTSASSGKDLAPAEGAAT